MVRLRLWIDLNPDVTRRLDFGKRAHHLFHFSFQAFTERQRDGPNQPVALLPKSRRPHGTKTVERRVGGQRNARSHLSSPSPARARDFFRARECREERLGVYWRQIGAP